MHTNTPLCKVSSLYTDQYEFHQYKSIRWFDLLCPVLGQNQVSRSQNNTRISIMSLLTLIENYLSPMVKYTGLFTCFGPLPTQTRVRNRTSVYTLTRRYLSSSPEDSCDHRLYSPQGPVMTTTLRFQDLSKPSVGESLRDA